jgi:hypothetical protein
VRHERISYRSLGPENKQQKHDKQKSAQAELKSRFRDHPWAFAQVETSLI